MRVIFNDRFAFDALSGWPVAVTLNRVLPSHPGQLLVTGKVNASVVAGLELEVGDDDYQVIPWDAIEEVSVT